MALALKKVLVLSFWKAFYLAASHRQIKKITSLRPWRLCGENPFKDKGRMGKAFFLWKQ
jgi:hypothetical protein